MTRRPAPRPPHPTRRATERRALAVDVRHAGNLRRQRPALAEEPCRRPVDHHPVERAGPGAADDAGGERRRPVVVPVGVLADRIDERQVGAPQVGEQPGAPGSALAPVAHQLEPLVAGRRVQQPPRKPATPPSSALAACRCTRRCIATTTSSGLPAFRMSARAGTPAPARGCAVSAGTPVATATIATARRRQTTGSCGPARTGLT